MIVRKWSNQNTWQLQWKYRTLFQILHQQQPTTWATYFAKINCLMLTSTEHSFKLVLLFQTSLRLRCWFACLVSCLSSTTFIESCCLSSFFFFFQPKHVQTAHIAPLFDPTSMLCSTRFGTFTVLIFTAQLADVPAWLSNSDFTAFRGYSNAAQQKSPLLSDVHPSSHPNVVYAAYTPVLQHMKNWS